MRVPFGVGQAQGPGECLHDLRRGRGRPSLFEPGQIVGRDPGEPGEFLAAQPAGPAAPADGQADGLGREAFTPAAQHPAELPGLHGFSLRAGTAVVLALALLRKRDDCLTTGRRWPSSAPTAPPEPSRKTTASWAGSADASLLRDFLSR
jgi:hypothetical protein